MCVCIRIILWGFFSGRKDETKERIQVSYSFSTMDRDQAGSRINARRFRAAARQFTYRHGCGEVGLLRELQHPLLAGDGAVF